MLLNFGCWWHVNDWSYINPRSKWGEFLERIRGVLWAGFMSFPHPINDLNLRKFVYCKNDLWFYCRDGRNKQPPTKKKCRSARVPNSRSQSYAVQARFMSYLFRIQVSFLWHARFTYKKAGGSDQQPRGTNYQKSVVDVATKRKACPAWQ